MKHRFLAGAMAVCLIFSLLPMGALAAEEGVAPAAAHSEAEEAGMPDSRALTLPDADTLHTNEDFKPYDPGYPEKAQYGNYTLRIPALKDRLTFSTRNQNQLIGTLYAPGVSSGSGWKDATKQWGNVDTGLCFAASSSNLISWYLERYLTLHPDDNHGFETDPERIFDRFRRGWDSAEGGDQKEALSWYFTGGFPSNNHNPNGSELTGEELGGYLRYQLPHNSSDRWSLVSFNWDPQEAFSVFGSYEDDSFPYIEDVGGVGPGLPFSTLKSFSQQVLRQLHYGPCTISIITDQGGGGSGHAITLWGVDYDVNTGLITHIHVTDSDDSSSVGLFTVKVESGPNNDGVRLVQYPYHPPVGTPSRFTRIRDSILLYAPDVVQSNQGYTGPDAEIHAVIPDSDGTGVTVQVSNLDPADLEYGYSYDTDPDHVLRWQNDSHFSGLKPDHYYFFARVKETSSHAAGGTSAPSPCRVKTPSPATQETVASLGLGTALFHPYQNAPQYLWFGTERGEDGTAPEEPILWRILDTKTNMQTEGLFLLSDKLYGTGTDGGLHFDQQPPYSNDYSESGARRWCQNFAQTNLNPLEQSAILPTSKTDLPYSTAFDGAPFILSNDKVFLPSAEEISSETYGFGTDGSRQARYRADSAAYWLRSPAAKSRSNAGYVTADGAVAQSPSTSSFGARPACNLNSGRVLYTAAVNNGLSSDRMGLQKIQSVQSQDFRLVLKDTDRTFHVTDSELTAQSGETVTLGYEGAKVSPSGNEFISLILTSADGTTPLYYGKIAAVTGASGEISLTLPSDLAEGSYVLKVFNEQFNGEKQTGTASPFCDVALTVTVPAATPVSQVSLSLTAPVTGQTPQNAVVREEGCSVVSTTWSPDDSVFQADTDYRVSLVVTANAGYTFTENTVFTLNGETVAPVAEGDSYVIHYAGFPRTEADRSGWQSDSNGWWYNDQNGSYVTGWQQIGSFWFYFSGNGYMQTGWQLIGGNWFYLDENGHMLTGWQLIGGSWFYLNQFGHMLTGWQWIDGKCYYFYGSGAMAVNTWIGGSYVDASGAWVEHPVSTGWQSNSIGWWYNDQNGNYVTGWQLINGNWFYFSGNGYMQTGWQLIGGNWFYLNGSGHMLTGWQLIGGNWFYLNASGHMLTGWQWIDGKCYYFYGSGAMAVNTWIGGSYVDGSGAWVQ